MLIWLTICNSVAAVRAGPLSPANGNTTPNGNASPNNNGNTPSTSGSGSQDTNLNGSYKFCRCVDGDQGALKTPTSAVYQNYLPTLGSIKLDYDSTGAPYVSHSVFIITSRSLFSLYIYIFLSLFSLANFFSHYQCENDSNWNGNDFKKLCVNAGDGAVSAQCWN
jgi:hypothetical protein